jgi:hypothetical protein
MDVNLADLVGAVASALPERGALVCDGDRLTYAEVMTRSHQVAAALTKRDLTNDKFRPQSNLSSVRSGARPMPRPVSRFKSETATQPKNQPDDKFRSRTD